MSFFEKAQRIAYPLRDPVTSDLDRYLAKYDKEDRRASEINEAADELLAGEYSPFLPANVNEAIGEMSQDQIAELAMMLQAKSFAVAGSYLREMVIEYWVKLAADKAETDVDLRAKECSGCVRRYRCSGECGT